MYRQARNQGRRRGTKPP